MPPLNGVDEPGMDVIAAPIRPPVACAAFGGGYGDILLTCKSNQLLGFREYIF